MGEQRGQVHHRLPGCFIGFPSCVINKKILASPYGETRTESTNSAVPPCLPVKPTAHRVPTHSLPSNAGTASEDTEGRTPFSLPSAAHLLSRFSPRSQPPGLSVDALKALLPLLRFGSNELNTYIQRFCLFVKNFFASGKNNF